jgi:hypothetical protein
MAPSNDPILGGQLSYGAPVIIRAEKNHALDSGL